MLKGKMGRHLSGFSHNNYLFIDWDGRRRTKSKVLVFLFLPSFIHYFGVVLKFFLMMMKVIWRWPMWESGAQVEGLILRKFHAWRNSSILTNWMEGPRRLSTSVSGLNCSLQSMPVSKSPGTLKCWQINNSRRNFSDSKRQQLAGAENPGIK